jgi:List-Bact-rpt repeat protein/ASPM-SPD-2-Hydin domain-containing protein/centrosomal CEP192-like protein
MKSVLRFKWIVVAVLTILLPLVVLRGVPRANFTFTPRSLTFAPQVIDPSGGHSAVQTVVVKNTGNASGNVPLLTTSGSFSMVSHCLRLSPGTSCTVDVSFGPTQLGTIQGQLSSVGVARVTLLGTGIAAVGVSPTALDFGSVAIGSSSAAQHVTITNNQAAALAVSGVAASGGYLPTNNCPTSLAAGASCTIDIVFKPAYKGSIPGALSISTDATLAAQPVGLTGIGLGSTTSQVSFSPATLSFGSQEAGTTSAGQTVTLTNNSSSTSLNIQSVTASAGYSETDTCSSPVAPSGTCTITVTFQPAANLVTAPYPGAITVVDSSPTSPHAIALSGTGVAPVSASPSSLDFGIVNQSATSAAQTITLQNFHGANEDIATISPPRPFSIGNTDCGSTVAGGGKCTIDVTAGPSSTLGPQNFALTYNFSSAGFLSPQVVNLSACITPVIRTPTSLNFGAVSVGQTSAPEIVTLNGSGITFSGFSINGSNASDFTIANNTCTGPLNGSCTVDLTFAPSTSGTRNATLQIADDGACSPQPVQLTGGSSAGPFVITSIVGGTGSGTVSSIPTGVDCGSQGATCSANFPTGTTVTLTATPDLNSHFVGWGGACSGKSTCVLTMNADRQITATFDLNPQLTVNVSTNLSGGGSVTSSPAGIDCPANSCQAFYATGTAVTLTATPSTGSTFVGWTNGACSGTGTCKITMNADAHVDATFNGPPTLQINLPGSGTGNVTSSPAGINCPATCSATFPKGTVVTLTETVSGNSTFGGWDTACSGTGACSVTMNADQIVGATFNGAPDFAVDVAALNNTTVAPGGSVRFSVGANAVNGFSGTVSLTCTAPVAQGVNCAVTPNSIQPGAIANMIVSTRGPSAKLAPVPGMPRSAPIYASWIPLLAVSLLGTGSLTSNRSRRKVVAAAACLGLTALLALVACGGGGPKDPGTLPGTYSVTVTESSGSIQHSTSVSITVQ